ncbi:hypothetical protein NE686_17745 [Tissierella carlieri]|uniref:Uncharacterized protein n=1 Tax=Tissierella carlieri TaxID=689904 RepID=A0ABT1SEN0_9FIRM|nr:hypothetical protein [Tissierella carlieri]MCQ4924948.1 hypothetical protein [Tissierella carlieri]
MLSLEEIDNKLIELRKIYNENGGLMDDILANISELEDDYKKLEKDNDIIEAEIKTLEKELTEGKFSEVDNTSNGNKFRDLFIKSSYFCRRDDERLALAYVELKEKQLLALDGYKGIIIDCDYIPKELQNSYIKWNVRQDFEKEVIRELSSQRSNLDDIIENGKSSLIININQDEFMNKFHKKTIQRQNGRNISVLEYEGKKVAFNQKYLDIVIMVFHNMDIKVYYPRDKKSPMIIESSTQRVILLPVSMDDIDY